VNRLIARLWRTATRGHRASHLCPARTTACLLARGDRLGTTSVWTAGAVPLDAAGDVVGPGDHRALARQVLDNLLVALREAGADQGRSSRRPCMW
jgi:enamine deaminase RidA (YjgF/YER057c/UK114 family)